MKNTELEQWKENIDYDFILVAGWYHMLPKSWVENEICLGLHASLLPDLRGGAPLVWAMIEGRQKTGVTLFQMNQEVDAGPIWIQEEFLIENDDYIVNLLDKTAEASLRIVSELFSNFSQITPQINNLDPKKHKVYSQRTPQDGEITTFKDIRTGLRFIRAQSKPYPGAYLIQSKLKIYLWKAEILNFIKFDSSLARFQIFPEYALLHYDNGTLKITEYEIF